MTKQEKAILSAELGKVWNAKMQAYCTNKAAEIATMDDGGIITIDKKKIETHFCFGEHGYDYDDAQKQAAHARTSEQYFYNENMEYYRSLYKTVNDIIKGNNEYMIVINDIHYTNQPADCLLRSYQIYKTWQILEMFGGSAYLDKLPGEPLPYALARTPGHIATRNELNAILKAIENAGKAHAKKVETYLKRYGTSKVHAWTYWADA